MNLNFFVLSLVALIVILFFSKSIRDEGFYGVSPGTLDQLRSTSVPDTRETDPSMREIEALIREKMVQRGIASMTEGDASLPL